MEGLGVAFAVSLLVFGLAFVCLEGMRYCSVDGCVLRVLFWFRKFRNLENFELVVVFVIRLPDSPTAGLSDCRLNILGMWPSEASRN